MTSKSYNLTFWQKSSRFFSKLPSAIVNGIKKIVSAIFKAIIAFFLGIGHFFQKFIKGDVKTKISFFIMGFGNLARGQIIRGILFLGVQVGYIFYMINMGGFYLSKFGTLGTVLRERVLDKDLGIYLYKDGDSSIKILLFGVVSIAICIAFIAVYVINVCSSYKAEQTLKKGEKLPRFKDDIGSLLNEKFHITMLSIPTLMVTAFTILPIIFMICMAFTNFDKAHQPPGNLFTWTGFDTFHNMFSGNPFIAKSFGGILAWTLVWAVFATFTNYIFGIILAMLINKKGIKLKGMWRTIFVITIAVPQFVTLMLMSKFLDDNGGLNALLIQLGLISEPIKFLTSTALARVTVIVVNMWVGIPHTMLITTGILMNIPEDMYESARIDGAGPLKIFSKITLPYMLFVTTPHLITQFVGNINNFNLIYFLSGGGPVMGNLYQAGDTDLLVTWLYKLSIQFQDYNLASAVGIIIFIITATFSLISYNLSASSRKEGQFS